MIKFLKNLFKIANSFDNEIKTLHKRLDIQYRNAIELEKLIKDRTNIGLDIANSYKGANHIIVVGCYKGVDYVQTYNLNQQDLVTLVEMLKTMDLNGRVKRVDAMPQIRAIFKREEL